MRSTVIGLCLATIFPGMALADDVTVSSADCRKLVQHVPNADVEYKPGVDVDVHGNAVAPADLGGGYNLKLPDEISIQIGVPLARRLGVNAGNAAGASSTAASSGAPSTTSPSSGGASSNGASSPSTTTARQKQLFGYAPVGTLTVKGSDVYWNGELLGQQDQVALAQACRKGLTQKPASSP